MHFTTAATGAGVSHRRAGCVYSAATRLSRCILLTVALLGCDTRENRSATKGSDDTSTPSTSESGGTGPASEETSDTGAEYPSGTCVDIIDAQLPVDQDPHPVASFWACASKCGIETGNDTQGLAGAMSQMSYDQLQPDQPDGCYELRTALYQCFDALTCPEVAAWREAANAGTDGPCTAEYYALEPHIPECGI